MQRQVIVGEFFSVAPWLCGQCRHTAREIQINTSGGYGNHAVLISKDEELQSVANFELVED